MRQKNPDSLKRLLPSQISSEVLLAGGEQTRSALGALNLSREKAFTPPTEESLKDGDPLPLENPEDEHFCWAGNTAHASLLGALKTSLKKNQ